MSKGPFTPEGEHWILQADGKPYWPERPDPDVVSLDVIAQSLSQKVRFGGHGWPFYSVAQHSLLVREIARRTLRPQVESGIATPYYVWTVQRAALMHDAHEAWMVDLPSPLKKLPWIEPKWRELEHAWDEVIFGKFGIEVSDQIRKAVKTFDLVAMRLEGQRIMPTPPGEWEWPGHGASAQHVIELAEELGPIMDDFTGLDPRYWYEVFKDTWEAIEQPPKRTEDDDAE